MKRSCLLVVSAVAVMAGLHLCSPKRDLEVALGVRQLPPTLRYFEVSTHTFTDYSVYAYFRIDPRDLDALLSVRPYRKLELSEGTTYTVAQAFPNSMKKVFPSAPGFEAADVYDWRREGMQVFCYLWTDLGAHFPRSLAFEGIAGSG